MRFGLHQAPGTRRLKPSVFHLDSFAPDDSLDLLDFTAVMILASSRSPIQQKHHRLDVIMNHHIFTLTPVLPPLPLSPFPIPDPFPNPPQPFSSKRGDMRSSEEQLESPLQHKLLPPQLHCPLASLSSLRGGFATKNSRGNSPL